MSVTAVLQQISAEVKERNMLRAAIDKIRKIAKNGMPAPTPIFNLTDDEKILLDIIEVCEDAIRQMEVFVPMTDAANKEGKKT